MIEIQLLQPEQVYAAKMVVSAVAQRIFYPDSTPEAFFEVLREEGELEDMDNFQEVYLAHQGIFLAVLDDGELVGTGALKRVDAEVAELKRLWLLEQYHGQGIGYQVVTRLFDFARQNGYKIIRLQTGSNQERALAFYKRLGFSIISSYRASMDDISMELRL